MLMAGCGQTSKSTQGNASKKMVIGVSMAAHDQYLQSVTDAINAQGKKLGIEIKSYNADGNIQTQLNDVDNLISQKVDAIILDPFDRDGLNAAVDKIKKAGIPLVETVASTTNTKYDVYVGSKDEDAGKIQAEYVAKNIGEKGKMVLLLGPIGQSGELGRLKGLQDNLLSKYPDWKVLAKQTGNWSRDQGMKIMEDWLQRYKDIDVVAAQNDEMALGALAAIDKAGKTGKIKVLGVDAEPDAAQAILDGKMTMTVFQDAKSQGTEAVNVAQGLVKGKHYSQEDIIPYTEVNKDNANDFLKK